MMSNLPTITLGRVVILVRDYTEALRFYQEAFGAEVLFDAPAPDGTRYLHLGFSAAGAQNESGGSGASTGIWFLRPKNGDETHVGRQTGGEPLAVFYTDDVEGAARRVADAGGKRLTAVVESGGARHAHVADLYGNVFVLVEFLEKSGG